MRHKDTRNLERIISSGALTAELSFTNTRVEPGRVRVGQDIERLKRLKGDARGGSQDRL